MFKRFKSLAQLGHVPKYDDESAKAWLYGKLFVALLVEKLIHHARTISPWCQRSPERASFSTVRRPQHVGGQDWASSARASLDERARSRRQGREPREAGVERSDAP